MQASPSWSGTSSFFPPFPPRFPLPRGGRCAPAAVRGAEGATDSGVTPVPPPVAVRGAVGEGGGTAAALRLATPSALPSPFPIDFWIIKWLRRCEASLSIAASPPPAGRPRAAPQPRVAAAPGKGGVAG